MANSEDKKRKPLSLAHKNKLIRKKGVGVSVRYRIFSKLKKRTSPAYPLLEVEQAKSNIPHVQIPPMWSTVTPTLGSPVPCARSKLAVCFYNNSIFLLGGRNRNQQIRDFWRYNIGEHKWEELKCKGDVPPRLEDHTIIPWKGRLYVFGGEVGFASTGETPLWIYDIDINTWRKKWRYNTIVQPQGCRGHTAVVYRGAMHIYGGYRDLRGSSNEMWSFDFASEMWHLTVTTNSTEFPPGRHNHSAVVHDSAMWIYGGMTNLQERMDFWRWDFDTKHWTRIRCKGGPGELNGHTACKVFSSMLLFGGERARQPVDTLWRFHFATETWEKLSVTGVLPGPRSRHCSIVIPSIFLVPPEMEKAQRPKSIPCRSSLGRNYDARKRPVSSPPKPESDDDGYTDPPNSNWSRYLGNGTKHSDSHNQLNFRMLRERISNVSLLKTSYSTYSALSNSSDSVQEDEPDEVAEMQSSSRGKLRSISQSACALPTLQPAVNFHSRPHGESISRDLMSVPNFQQLQNVAPAREVTTPQSTVPSSVRYSLHGRIGDWTSSLQSPYQENSAFDFQYYALLHSNGCHNGFENAFTDSEDSGIHGFKSTDPSPAEKQQSKLEESQVLLPGMVEDLSESEAKTHVPSTAKRSISVYEDFALIDLHHDNAETAFNNGHSTMLPNGSLTPATPYPTSFPTFSKMLPSSVNTSTRDSKVFEFHKDFASCLNYVGNNPTNRNSIIDVELQTFPSVSDGKPVRTKSNLDDFVSVPLSIPLDPQAAPFTLTSPSNPVVRPPEILPEDPLDDNSNECYRQSRHFSMLIFGGREEVQQSCLSKPLIIWRCEVWR